MLRLLPIGLGVYLSSLATASTRRRVDSSTAPLEFNARETVAVETFALLATSLIVGFMRWTCVSGYMKREKNTLQCNRLHCKEISISCQVGKSSRWIDHFHDLPGRYLATPVQF